MYKNREEEIQIQLAQYLAIAYPDVLFHSDIGSGVRLPIKLAKKAKDLNGGRRGWPDLFIAKRVAIEYDGQGEEVRRRPVNGLISVEPETRKIKIVGGLFIELKAEGIKLKKKNGEWVKEHFAEQAAVLEELRKAGYKAEFAVGFAEAKKLIDEYLDFDKYWGNKK
ncbi:hypothetical protein IJH89_01345 [Candidatus Saccharibacteria bacterium]|nr:hypothetical protein [Candidatus Saccharibacteria bacterium]